MANYLTQEHLQHVLLDIAASPVTLYWLRLTDSRRQDWQFSKQIWELYQLPYVFLKYISYSGWKLQVLLWEHFLRTLFIVCMYTHVILQAGSVSTFSYWMKLVPITYFYPDYGQQPKKILSWQHTTENTQTMDIQKQCCKDNTWN